MKYILIMLIAIFTGFNSKAQDPQLLENDWYIQKVIIDDIEHLLPFSSFRGILNLGIDFISVNHPYCEEGYTAEVLEYLPNNIFNLGNGGVVLIGVCGQPEIVNFMNFHYSVYHDLDTQIAKNSFAYALTTENGILTLTIVNGDGDIAIYGNELLSNQDFKTLFFTIYPNPVKNILQINNQSRGFGNIVIKNIQVYSVLGKKLLETKNINQIDVSTLASGLLFVKIATDNGFVLKKVVKE